MFLAHCLISVAHSNHFVQFPFSRPCRLSLLPFNKVLLVNANKDVYFSDALRTCILLLSSKGILGCIMKIHVTGSRNLGTISIMALFVVDGCRVVITRIRYEYMFFQLISDALVRLVGR